MVVAVRGEVSRISAGRLGNSQDPLARVGAVLQQENEQLLAQPRALNYRPGALKRLIALIKTSSHSSG